MKFHGRLPEFLSRLLILLITLGGCSTTAWRPCTQGNQPGQTPFEDGKPGKGTKQCEQVKDSSGRYVNHGRYIEWHPNGKRSIEGQYLGGVKNGKWITWDEQGKQLVEKWYENGEVVQGREAQPYNGLGVQPKASAPLLTSKPPEAPAKSTGPAPVVSPSPNPTPSPSGVPTPSK